MRLMDRDGDGNIDLEELLRWEREDEQEWMRKRGVLSQLGEKSESQHGTMCKDEYVHLLKLMYKLLMPVYNEAEACRAAVADWSDDNAGRPVMRFDTFLDGMYNLIDVWTLSCLEREYVELCELLTNAIVGPDGRVARHARDVQVRASERREREKEARGGRKGWPL